MGSAIVSWVIEIFGQGIGKIIGVFFISMLPVIELRGAIPVAYALGLNWQTAMIVAIIGNMFPIPFILLFLDFVFKFMKEHNILKNLVVKLENKAVASSDKVTKYKFWGLAIFVGIPLPGTGGWTGALIASVMKMRRKAALLSIFIGVVVAAILVTMATYGVFGSIVG